TSTCTTSSRRCCRSSASPAATATEETRCSTGKAPVGALFFGGLRPIEDGDALDMRGMREHVDRARRGAAKAAAMHQQTGIAGGRARIAAAEAAPRRPPPVRGSAVDEVGERLDDGERALARRIDQ